MNPLDARRRLLGRNVYKKTVEGNPAIAQGSLARMYPGITMQGWTEQAKTTGAQLFDASKIQTKTQGGATATNNGDGSFTINGNGNLTEAFSVVYRYSREETLKMLKSGKITLNTESNTNPYVRIGIGTLLLTNNAHGEVKTAEITSDILENESTVLELRIYGSAGSAIVSGTFKPMVYQNGNGTYEPYTGGAPSPSPEYPQPITSAGKYNEETQKWEYGIEVGCGQLAEDSVVSHPEGEYVPDKIIFSGNITGEYTISLEEVGEVSYTQPSAGIIKITINGKDKIIGKQHLPYTFSGNITEITVFSSNSYIRFTGTIKFMLNPGSTPLPYTPYRPPQTVTLTSDRPLTKWDKLEKRDGQWGWVYKSAEVVLDGSEDEDWRPQADTSRKIQFYIPLPDALYPYTIPFDEMFYCNTFFTTNASGAIPNWQVRKGAHNGLAPVFKPGDDINTVDLFRAFLAENPTTILYVTKEETFIPLSESEQELMNALYTFRPTTVLDNDQGCDMALTYIADTKAYIDNKVSAIQAAIVNAI